MPGHVHNLNEVIANKNIKDSSKGRRPGCQCQLSDQEFANAEAKTLPIISRA